jgi:hypothetical protein
MDFEQKIWDICVVPYGSSLGNTWEQNQKNVPPRTKDFVFQSST